MFDKNKSLTQTSVQIIILFEKKMGFSLSLFENIAKKSAHVVYTTSGKKFPLFEFWLKNYKLLCSSFLKN